VLAAQVTHPATTVRLLAQVSQRLRQRLVVVAVVQILQVQAVLVVVVAQIKQAQQEQQMKVSQVAQVRAETVRQVVAVQMRLAVLPQWQPQPQVVLA